MFLRCFFGSIFPIAADDTSAAAPVHKENKTHRRQFKNVCCLIKSYLLNESVALVYLFEAPMEYYYAKGKPIRVEVAASLAMF
jgi:hypothetical protein